MPKVEKNVPELRFKGFSDPWEQRKLKDVAPLQRGFDLPKSEINEGPYPVLFSNGIGGWHSEYKVKAPGVITGRSGSIGNVVFIEQNYWPHNTSLWVTSFFDNYPRYVYYLYQYIDLSKFGTGSGVPTLNRNDVHDYSVIIPKPEEQTRIASFFKSIDDTIALHQRKLEKSKALKSAYLSEMFPAEGERKPKRRFAGFTDDWELRRFSELAEIRRGLTYSPVNIRLEGIRVLRSSNIDEDTFTFGEDDVFVDKGVVKSPLVKEGDILITAANGSSRLVGKHTIIKDLPENSAIHGGFMLLASCRNPEFINSLMSSAWYTKFINLYVAGGNGAIGNLNKHDLDEQNVLVPSQKEQSAIGTFFSTLDQQITLHQRKS